MHPDMFSKMQTYARIYAEWSRAGRESESIDDAKFSMDGDIIVLKPSEYYEVEDEENGYR